MEKPKKKRVLMGGSNKARGWEGSTESKGVGKGGGEKEREIIRGVLINRNYTV